MAGSPLSLESLSSPSPSPSPPPGMNKPSEPNSAGLNSDSELSELTEEEQEADKTHKSPRKSQRNKTSRRGRHASRRGARRKTNSIVPAPMWGWAETKSSNALEEEEEEEFKGPPRAMEEEEEDDESRDDEEDELGRRKIPDEAEGDPTDEEDPPVLNGADHENDDESFVSGNDAPRHCRDYSRRSRRNGSLAASVESDDEDRVENPNAPLNGDGDEADVEPDENDDGSDFEPPPVHLESGNETESENEPAVDSKTNLSLDQTTTDAMLPQVSASRMDVDQEIVPPTNIAAEATISSLIGSTKLIDPHSPSPSSQSAPSSRSPSLAPCSDTEELPCITGNSTPEDEALNVRANEPDLDVSATIVSTTIEIDAVEPDAADEQAADQDTERPQEQDVDVEDQDDVDLEVESDLQPAYRAEALDVLATIELKFALLRERVYVEKMEGLAWEEALVSDETHPELTHLQNELTSRRDKRLQLASRKRSFEINNIHKRRRADEDAIWSWWKFARDELQTDMISETNRKRRRLERDRRAIERPQPLRRIPSLPQDLPPTPSLRKIIRSSYPFDNFSATRNAPASRRQSKRRQRHYRHSHAYATYGPQKLIYPDLPTLSPFDVANDLDFLLQARLERDRSSNIGARYDMHLHPPQPHQKSINVGVGVVNATGLHIPPPIITESRPTGYGVGYEEVIGLAGGGPGSFVNGGGLRGQPAPFPHPHQHQTLQHLVFDPLQQHPPPPQSQSVGPGLGSSQMSSAMPHMPTSFVGPPATRVHIHSHQHSQPLIYAQRHEHHTTPQHHHRALHHPPSSFPTEQEFTGLNGVEPGSHQPYFGPPGGPQLQILGGRRSNSPPPTGIMPNGAMNNSWSVQAKGGDWDDGRDEATKERTKREKEHSQGRDLERERREREREREHQEMEREWQKDRNTHHMHQTQPRHLPPPHHHHSSGGQQPLHHHANGTHHHHHRHHLHVLHHHHQSQPQPGTGGGNVSSSLGSSGAPRSPGGTYHDYENSVRSHHSHNQHPTEVINLTSAKASPATQLWKNDEQQRQHSSPPEPRDTRSKHGRSQAPPSSGFGIPEDRETRPPTIPFASSSSHAMASSTPPPGPNGTSRNTLEDDTVCMPGPSPSTGVGSSAPGYLGFSEGGTHIYSPGHRYPGGSSVGGSMVREPPPPLRPTSGPASQQQSRQSSLGLHSPPRPSVINHNRPPLGPSQSGPPSSTTYSNSSSNRSPARFVPPPPSLPTLPQGSHQHQRPMTPKLHSMHPSRSPPVSLKTMQPPSPSSLRANKMLSGPLPHPINPLPTAGTYSSPRLSGPGRTSTPTGSTGADSISMKTSVSGPGSNLSTRTPTPLSMFSSSHSHANANGLTFNSGPRMLLTSSVSGVNGGTAHSGLDRNWERERDREIERDRDWSEHGGRERERDHHVPSPHLGPLPPPPKFTIPQMVDGH